MARPPKGFKKSLKLFSQRWDIVYVNGEIKEDQELGMSEGHHRRITLHVGQSRESLIDTLIHECAHSYLRMLPGASDGFEFPNPERTEEACVVAATSLTMDLLRANPWVAALVLDG